MYFIQGVRIASGISAQTSGILRIFLGSKICLIDVELQDKMIHN